MSGLRLFLSIFLSFLLMLFASPIVGRAVLDLFVWAQINYWDVLRFRRADGTSKNDVSSTHNVEWEMASKHMLGAREAGMCLSRLQFSFIFFSIYISRSHLPSTHYDYANCAVSS